MVYITVNSVDYIKAHDFSLVGPDQLWLISRAFPVMYAFERGFCCHLQLRKVIKEKIGKSGGKIFLPTKLIVFHPEHAGSLAGLHRAVQKGKFKTGNSTQQCTGSLTSATVLISPHAAKSLRGSFAHSSQGMPVGLKVVAAIGCCAALGEAQCQVSPHPCCSFIAISSTSWPACQHSQPSILPPTCPPMASAGY